MIKRRSSLGLLKEIFAKSTILMVFTCTLFVGNVQAIDKDLHKPVTEEAIKQFNNICAKELELAPIGGAAAKRIALYTEKEDVISLWNLQRLFNWHFYDHYAVSGNPDDAKYILSAGKSMHRTFNNRTEDFTEIITKDKSDKKYYEVSGRILHYLQDVGIPAHVGPNYHVKPDKWYEKIFVKSQPDPFDSLVNPTSNSYNLSASHCRQLYKENEKAKNKLGSDPKKLFQGLLIELAENTRTAVRKGKFPNSGVKFEEAFWSIYDPTEEGSYPPGIKPKFAPYGKSIPYNEKTQRTRFNLGALPCTGANEGTVCKDFVKTRYEAIIDTTLRALMYIVEFRKTP